MSTRSANGTKEDHITIDDEPPNERQVREKLIYTGRGGAVAAELDRDTLKCLAPTNYLNDEVVQFYLAYLKNEHSAEFEKRIHVFDNIFHDKLTEAFLEKSVDQQKWKELNKWFSGVDLFEKDFLLFPVCDQEHWLAIIVCYPSEVRAIDDLAPPADQGGPDNRNRPVPGIIVMDSLGMNNKLITRHIRDFLNYEWRTRLTVVKDFFYHRLDQYHPQLPKQTNAYDCGIFMLAYVKAFMKSPDRFYRNVRKNKDAGLESLVDMVHDALADCSRESIKKVINTKCKLSKDRAIS